MKTYLIIPDCHAPYHCTDYQKVIIKVLKNMRFDGIVQLGDIVDFWQLSTYDKDPERKNTIKDDLDEVEKMLVSWAKCLPRNAEIHLICGNHENRLSRYIGRQAKELHGLVPSIPEILKLKQKTAAGHVKYFWHPYSKWNSCKIGDCVLFHGFYFNAHTAATNLAKYRCNTISGHTHRVQIIHDGVHYAVSLGHASNEEETAHSPAPTGWTKAFAILYVSDDGKTSVDVITIKNNMAVVNGKIIKA